MRILLVEDDREISRFIKKGLKAESHAVDVARDGEEGLHKALENEYDLLILDFYLPKQNGIAVARGIREKNTTTPIIALTSEDAIDTKVMMLDYCDDYVTKPFSFKELIARIHAVTRRGKVPTSKILRVGSLVMDRQVFKVTRDGKELNLRPKEFMLLEFLMEHPGVVFSKERILEHVWDAHADPFTNTVEVHITRLREKVDKNFKKKLIQTIPKRGYCLYSE